MTDPVKAPWHLLVVGILTLLWNSIGAMSYTFTRLNMLESLDMTADQIAYFDSYPFWVNSVWALGVWGALVGSILLLVRSRHAVTAIVISVLGLIGTSIYQHVLTQTPQSLQSPGLAISIWLTTLFMLWYAMRMKSAGVLR